MSWTTTKTRKMGLSKGKACLWRKHATSLTETETCSVTCQVKDLGWHHGSTDVLFSSIRHL
jgi:hypothetical protein